MCVVLKWKKKRKKIQYFRIVLFESSFVISVFIDLYYIESWSYAFHVIHPHALNNKMVGLYPSICTKQIFGIGNVWEHNNVTHIHVSKWNVHHSLSCITVRMPFFFHTHMHNPFFLFIDFLQRIEVIKAEFPVMNKLFSWSFSLYLLSFLFYSCIMLWLVFHFYFTVYFRICQISMYSSIS